MLGMKICPFRPTPPTPWPCGPASSPPLPPTATTSARTCAWCLPMGLAGLLGGTAGALVLLNTPQMTFLHLVPWLLLVAASIFALERSGLPLAQRAAGARRRGRCPDAVRRAACRSFWPRWRSAFISATSAPARAFCSSPCSRSSATRICTRSTPSRWSPPPWPTASPSFLRFQRPGGLALLPAGHGGLRHRRLLLGPPGPPRSRSPCCAGWWSSSAFHGRMVLLSGTVNSGQWSVSVQQATGTFTGRDVDGRGRTDSA
jgi:hypothetical protein